MTLMEEVQSELTRARQLYPAFNSAHEGWAVLNEEMEELWVEVKRQGRTAGHIRQMRQEAIQVAAMAIRFIEDICDKEGISLTPGLNTKCSLHGNEHPDYLCPRWKEEP